MSAPSPCPSAPKDVLPPDGEALPQQARSRVGPASPPGGGAVGRAPRAAGPPGAAPSPGAPAASVAPATGPITALTRLGGESPERPRAPGTGPEPGPGARQLPGISSHSVAETSAPSTLTLRIPLEGPYKAHKEALLREFERAYFTRLLERCEGNVARTAREAGLDRKHLYSILHRHGLL